MWRPLPTGDFQDLRAWRRLTVQTSVALVDEWHRQPCEPVQLVAPMTLTVPAYRDELLEGLESSGLAVHEVVLTASPEALEARIQADVLFPDGHTHVASKQEGERPEPTCIVGGGASTGRAAISFIPPVGDRTTRGVDHLR